MKQQLDDSCGPGERKQSSPPPCCGTGCTVCVLDYPELFETPQESSSGTLALLEAFEQAQAATAARDDDSQ